MSFEEEDLVSVLLRAYLRHELEAVDLMVIARGTWRLVRGRLLLGLVLR